MDEDFVAEFCQDLRCWGIFGLRQRVGRGGRIGTHAIYNFTEWYQKENQFRLDAKANSNPVRNHLIFPRLE